MSVLDWSHRNCTDPELHDPDEGTLEAKAACEACPIIEQCLAYALERPVQVGYAGGRTAAERRRLRGRRTGRTR